jgi:NAD(P)H-hydrate epimerase
MFGTGLERPLEDPWLDAIRAMNAGSCPIVALDVPSGLHADSGRVLGAAVHASITVTFIGLKAGLFTGAGRDHAGDILFDDLALPATVFDRVVPSGRRLTPDNLRHLLVPRSRHAHKGDAGRVLIVGGQPGMPGATRLAGEAAYRAGAGLVTIATHPAHAEVVASTCPELITSGVNNPAELEALLPRASVVALGPGLGQSAWAQELFELVVRSERPLVLDADALNLLAARPRMRSDWILTPHPGEAGRLLDCPASQVQADRFAAVHALVARHGGVCVLKGSGTLVSGGDSPVWLCDRGNPGLASGGTGDVLTGVIAALVAQGLAALDAARLGVWLHATAGDAAARAGERGLMASDLFTPLRTILNETT